MLIFKLKTLHYEKFFDTIILINHQKQGLFMNKIDKLFKLHEEYDFHNKKLNRGLEKRNQGLLFLFFSAFILTLTIFLTMIYDISSDAENWS